MKRLCAIAATALALAGCAHSDRALLVTEDGLRAADMAWDAHYNAKADQCEAEHEPDTPGMEACFGPTYDANFAVEIALHSAVGALRAYWAARAAGEEPGRSLMEIMADVKGVIDALPPEAREYFSRVTGF